MHILLKTGVVNCVLFLFLAKGKKRILDTSESCILKSLCQALIVTPVKGHLMVSQQQVERALKKTEEGRVLVERYGLAKLTDKVRYLIKSRPFKEPAQ